MMQPPERIPQDVMVTDDVDESQDAQQTQSTQQASQSFNTHIDGHLWGFLQPCSPALTRIDFWKINPSVSIGRNQETNNVVLPGFKVSNKHCKVVWDGKEDRTSSVIIHDFSSNGTFINGEKIGKERTGILREGNEVAFGTSQPQPQNGGLEDYRFVYRHTAGGPPNSGLYAFYDIGTELGKGSFATVMKAVSRETGLWYAVKMIQDNKMKVTNDPPANNNNAVGTTSFAREISILETLKHPNICQLKETFVQDASIYLVLELVEGGDLLDYIVTRNGLSEPAAQHITYQICDALAYIHSKGIAHRDLKPENVLMTTDDPPMVKVADFGLAKVVDSLTMLRTMCGTPSYLAPEVVLQNNQEGYDHLVDSWSVGVIVFSMLTNTSPFIEDEDQRDLRTRIAERQVDWNSLYRVSDVGQHFIRRLLDVRPTHRMSLAEARDHPWLQGHGLPAPPVQPRTLPDDPSYESLAPDVSMLSSVGESDDAFRSNSGQHGDTDMSRGLAQLQLDQSAAPSVPGTPPGPNSQASGNGVRREGSRSLQRRSQVLSQAAEAEGPSSVPEPSWQMVQNIAPQGTDAAEPGGAGARGGRGNKRIHSELTPLPEEQDAEMVPLGDANSPRRKGGEEAPAKPVRAARGRGRGTPVQAKVLRGRVAAGVKEDAVSEDEEMGVAKPRRSSRQTPQKAARRA